MCLMRLSTCLFCDKNISIHPKLPPSSSSSSSSSLPPFLNSKEEEEEKGRQILIMTGSRGAFARITSGGIKKSSEEEKEKEEEEEEGELAPPSFLQSSFLHLSSLFTQRLCENNCKVLVVVFIFCFFLL